MLVCTVATGGLLIHSGFGVSIDLLFAAIVAAIGIPLVALLTLLLLTVFRSLPRLLTGLFIAVFLLIACLWGVDSVGLSMGALVLFAECALGATLAAIFSGSLRHAHLSRKIITYAIALLAVLANISLFAFLHGDGLDEELLEAEKSASQPPPLNASDPSQPGPYTVKTLFYGKGDDLRRPEYGPSVAIRTGPVDASPFFKDFSGWKAFLRRRYWGFGMNSLPVNARVWYPAGTGPFPLAIMVHGNHEMSEFSDPGYAYLGALLASRGYIFVSVDENFLNIGLFHEPPEQQPVRGWMLLEHLKLWHQWNQSPANPFFHKVDLENVALLGHSRGGEAAATAALFNKLAYDPDDAAIRFHYGFPIKSIVAIAPADGQYKPAGQPRILEDVNYLTIQGANDADLSSFPGSRQWDHVHFTGTGNFFKSELYAYRANHGQFNTVWGRTDGRAPQTWFLNLRPLLRGEEQRHIAQVYISAFLDATLRGHREYLPLFRDYRYARRWLPGTIYVNRYLDNSYKLISNFTEDADLTTTTLPGGRIGGQNLTVWREAPIPFRSGNRGYNGVFLGWNRETQKGASYSIQLPPNFRVDPDSALTLSAAVTDEDDAGEKPTPTDFTVSLQSQTGPSVSLPLSDFNVLPPLIKVRFTKLGLLDKMLYKAPSEPVFQTIQMPLHAFAAKDPHFDPLTLCAIHLLFDRTPSRVIILSQIGLSRNSPVSKF